MRTFTSESVTEGHPDKVADTISDAILTEALRQDPNSRVAVETMVSAGQVFVAGEMTTSAWIDISEVARSAICDIGYDSADTCFDGHTCGVLTNIVQQSSDIAQGVDKALEVRKIDEDSDPYDVEGAGDQGMMFGYATDETINLMPLPIAIAHALSTQLTKVRKDGTLPYLRPDGKTQVSIAYNDDNLPVGIDTIVVSTQHADDEQVFAQLHSDIMAYVIEPVLEEFKKTNSVVAAMDLSDVRLLVNPTGRFVNGGPAFDCGLTGRKIIVDTYGGIGRHGGGCFSGKDSTKVDRSASYAMRWVAKNIVAAGVAKRVEVQVAYAIGVARPVGFHLDTFGTNLTKLTDSQLADVVHEVFDLRPAAIIDSLDLRHLDYTRTTNYGHFGKPDLPWEKTNKVKELREAVRSFAELS